MDIIVTLLNIERELTLWIMIASPTDEAGRQRMMEVIALRDRLKEKINEVVALRTEIAAKGLTAQADELARINEKIGATTKSIETVKEYIEIAATAINVVLEIIKLVT